MKSVGVQRQYSGTAGRIEKCQVGVFLAYATSTGRTFLDRALYLLQEWIDDPARRADAKVPEAVTFATKPTLAHQMLEHAFAAQVPAVWVTGDEIYGDDGALRRWLETADRPYVLADTASLPLWHDGEQERADASVARLPANAWASLSAGSGSQGQRLYDWGCIRLPYPPTADDTAQWLLAQHSLTDPSAIAYYREYGRAGTDLPTLVQVAGMRWVIEEGFEDAKGAMGLDH